LSKNEEGGGPRAIVKNEKRSIFEIMNSILFQYSSERGGGGVSGGLSKV